jgi:hypothetical protein
MYSRSPGLGCQSVTGALGLVPRLLTAPANYIAAQGSSSLYLEQGMLDEKACDCSRPGLIDQRSLRRSIEGGRPTGVRSTVGLWLKNQDTDPGLQRPPHGNGLLIFNIIVGTCLWIVLVRVLVCFLSIRQTVRAVALI